MTRYSKTFAVTAAIIAVLAGCGGGPAPQVVVGDDVSASGQGYVNNYGPELHRAIDWVASKRGSVVVDVIDGNAAASFRQRYVGSFQPDPSLGGNDTLIRDDLATKAAQAARQAAATVATGGQNPGSDPLGFIIQAAKVLAHHPKQPRYLVLLSDMLQAAPADDRLDLYHEDLTARGVDRTIRRLRAEGKLPNLTGVGIVVVGGGRSAGGIGTDRAAGVERFWQTYLRAAGAHVASYGPRFAVP